MEYILKYYINFVNLMFKIKIKYWSAIVQYYIRLHTEGTFIQYFLLS